jgi:O-antigen/teichoic acid export membrane protein
VIVALGTQALGLALNYAFTVGVVLVAPVEQAGRVFWYLNLMFILTLVVAWGADSWFVRRRAAADGHHIGVVGGAPGHAGEAALRESAQLSAWILALLVPVVLVYILFVEGDGAVLAAAFVASLVGYAGCQLVSLEHEARGRRVAAMYFRAVAPYALATAVVGVLWLAGVSVTAEGVLASVAASGCVNLLVGGGAWLRRGLAEAVRARRLAECLREYLPNVGTAILNFTSAWLAVFVAKALLDDAQLAQVNFVLRIATVVSVPSVVVGVTFSARLAQARGHEQVRAVYLRSALAASLVAAPVFVGLVVLAPLMFEHLKPEYDLQLELAVVAAGHFVVMLFGAQYTLFAMTGNIARLNTSIVIATVLGGLIMVPATIHFGARGLLLAAAAALMVKPLVLALFSIDLLRPRRAP